MHIADILSVPDKWEYPFFAAWGTAFHCIPIAMIDPEFAKKQLDLFTREHYMKPDGAIPAYESNFSDANPPVHAWSAAIPTLHLGQRTDYALLLARQGDIPSI